MKTSMVALALGLSLSGQAMANDVGDAYIGGDLGFGKLTKGCKTSCEGESINLGVTLGYSFNDWLSFELGYSNEPMYEFNSTNVKTQSGLVGFKLDYSLSDTSRVFVVPGAMITEVKYDNFASLNDSAFSPFVDFGYESQISQKWSWLVKYRYRSSEQVSGIGDIESSSLIAGVRYTLFNDVRREKAKLEAVAPRPASSYETEDVVYVENDSSKVVTIQKLTFSESNVDDILFSIDSSIISNTKPLDTAFAQIDIESIVNIEVVGHTDSTGTASHNEKLSVDRAVAVANYLQALGVKADTILVRGQGEMSPVASNATKIGRAANRRVEITVFSK
ncbi:OmpA family protein [Vibrio tubiashii]|uniref:OmpA family protein n=1 Tax=Vibrio tubiashii TaxID=29498 RepID=UPI001EFD664B|nr:OmpA family protein [Vibrio tubiashii]MCG9576723.1 OmpA family protein [Vibrio tubiashii]